MVMPMKCKGILIIIFGYINNNKGILIIIILCYKYVFKSHTIGCGLFEWW